MIETSLKQYYREACRAPNRRSPIPNTDIGSDRQQRVHIMLAQMLIAAFASRVYRANEPVTLRTLFLSPASRSYAPDVCSAGLQLLDGGEDQILTVQVQSLESEIDIRLRRLNEREEHTSQISPTTPSREIFAIVYAIGGYLDGGRDSNSPAHSRVGTSANHQQQGLVTAPSDGIRPPVLGRTEGRREEAAFDTRQRLDPNLTPPTVPWEDSERVPRRTVNGDRRTAASVDLATNGRTHIPPLAAPRNGPTDTAEPRQPQTGPEPSFYAFSSSPSRLTSQSAVLASRQENTRDQGRPAVVPTQQRAPQADPRVVDAMAEKLESLLQFARYMANSANTNDMTFALWSVVNPRAQPWSAVESGLDQAILEFNRRYTVYLPQQSRSSRRAVRRRTIFVHLNVILYEHLLSRIAEADEIIARYPLEVSNSEEIRGRDEELQRLRVAACARGAFVLRLYTYHSKDLERWENTLFRDPSTLHVPNQPAFRLEHFKQYAENANRNAALDFRRAVEPILANVEKLAPPEWRVATENSSRWTPLIDDLLTLTIPRLKAYGRLLTEKKTILLQSFIPPLLNDLPASLDPNQDNFTTAVPLPVRPPSREQPKLFFDLNAGGDVFVGYSEEEKEMYSLASAAIASYKSLLLDTGTYTIGDGDWTPSVGAVDAHIALSMLELFARVLNFVFKAAARLRLLGDPRYKDAMKGLDEWDISAGWVVPAEGITRTVMAQYRLVQRYSMPARVEERLKAALPPAMHALLRNLRHYMLGPALAKYDFYQRDGAEVELNTPFPLFLNRLLKRQYILETMTRFAELLHDNSGLLKVVLQPPNPAVILLHLPVNALTTPDAETPPPRTALSWNEVIDPAEHIQRTVYSVVNYYRFKTAATLGNRVMDRLLRTKAYTKRKLEYIASYVLPQHIGVQLIARFRRMWEKCKGLVETMAADRYLTVEKLEESTATGDAPPTYSDDDSDARILSAVEAVARLKSMQEEIERRWGRFDELFRDGPPAPKRTGFWSFVTRKEKDAWLRDWLRKDDLASLLREYLQVDCS